MKWCYPNQWARFGRSAFIPAVLLILIGQPAHIFSQSDVGPEYEVKAAFLYSLAEFIQWPSDGSWRAGEDLVICIVGPDPFGLVLDHAVHGKTIAGHRVTVRRLKPGRRWTGCRIAFFGSTQADPAPLSIATTAAGVLTVGETRGFAEQGGMISFVMVEDRVRLEVNVDAAERGGLKISSKLLNLAKLVHGQASRGGS